MVAMVVFGGGGLSIYEGLHALAEPRTLTSLWPSFVVIGVAACSRARRC